MPSLGNTLGTAGSALITGGNAVSTPGPQKPQTPTTPTVGFPNSNIYLSFYGEDLGTGGNVQRFQAMMGDNPPTIVPGLPIYNEVSRPLFRNLLIFAGYQLAQMKVDLRFGQWPGGAWDVSDTAGKQNERDIMALDMMSGSASHYTAGPPQVVYVAAWSTRGGLSDVIPPHYQYTPGSGSKLFPWVIAGLEWGNSLRNPDGYRVYQEASITLKQYLNTTAPAPNQPSTQKAGGWFVATQTYNTALKIAGAPSSISPNQDHKILANRIIGASQNKHLHLRGINQTIKPNTKVWVPSHTQY